jgi:hypothetical protein
MELSTNIDKLGTAGLFLTALLSPCCFPLFALLASVLGLGSFELFGGWTMWVFQAMALLTIIGLYLSYRKHRFLYPLATAIFSSALIAYGYHFNNSDYWIWFLYAGMLGLLIATVWNYKRNKMYGSCNTCSTYNGKPVECKTTITCPHCRYQKEEIMPTNACVYFYTCDNCHARLKPRKGDCCVYCSYGTVKCPPIQAGEQCC